jgi:hypothetical protein
MDQLYRTLARRVAEAFAKLGGQPLLTSLGIDLSDEPYIQSGPDSWGDWCGFWCGKAGTFSVAGEFDISDEDGNRLSPDLVLEVSFVVHLRERQHLEPALERAQEAWTALVPTQGRARDVLEYPRSAGCQLPRVYLLRPLVDIERGVWVVARSRPVPTTDPTVLIDRGLDDVLSLRDLLEEAVHTVRGAIFGEVVKLDRNSVTGWLGEIAAFHQLRRPHPSLRWGPHWFAPYDLSADGVLFEVKATSSEDAGTMHFSTEEMATAVDRRGSYYLVRVFVAGEHVERILEILRDKKLEGTADSLIDPRAKRLAQIPGLGARLSEKRWSQIAQLIGEPPYEWAEVSAPERDPLDWMGKALDEAIVRQATLVLPHGRLETSSSGKGRGAPVVRGAR